ncbi:MAG: response regulator [Flavisolibacter sp.]|jgi:CheY-like chemotaxis protein|nr:response regulator [Flavisolibacter sp.]
MDKKIYMLEDDADDRYIIEEIISESGLEFSIFYFTSSEKLMEHIFMEMPALVLVDYNSSPANGFEVLKKIKSDSNISNLPVVILTEHSYPEPRKNVMRQEQHR